MKISGFGGPLLLFDFEILAEAERVLARGFQRVKERVLRLARWTPSVGCLGKGGCAKEMWVRVLGFPLHLWSRVVFKKIGDECGGFVVVDEDTTLMTNLHWARILVHPVGSSLPSSLQVVVGNSSFSLQLWWEAPSGFSFVELRKRNCVPNEQEVGGGVEVSSHTDEASGMGMHPLSIVASSNHRVALLQV